eukprot:1162143-Pelagomonas_calceolata.AAC.28
MLVKPHMFASASTQAEGHLRLVFQTLPLSHKAVHPATKYKSTLEICFCFGERAVRPPDKHSIEKPRSTLIVLRGFPGDRSAESSSPVFLTVTFAIRQCMQSAQA